MDSTEIQKLIDYLYQAKCDLENIKFKSRVDRRECNKVYKKIQKALKIAENLEEPMVKVED